jgi:hypothetical protein
MGLRFVVMLVAVVATAANAQGPTLRCDTNEAMALRRSNGSAKRVSERRLTVHWAGGTATFDSDSIRDFGSREYEYCDFNAAVGFHLVHASSGGNAVLLSQATGKILPAGDTVTFAPDTTRYFTIVQVDGHEGPDWYVYTTKGTIVWSGQAEHPTGTVDRAVGILESARWTPRGELEATLKCPGAGDTWTSSTVTLRRLGGSWTWLPSLKCRAGDRPE